MLKFSYSSFCAVSRTGVVCQRTIQRGLFVAAASARSLNFNSPSSSARLPVSNSKPSCLFLGCSLSGNRGSRLALHPTTQATGARRHKSTSLDRRVLTLARRVDYALRGLAKKWEQHYYTVDDCASFASNIARFHPDESWRSTWATAVSKWESYRQGTYDQDTLLPETEEDIDLARAMYTREQLLNIQLQAAQKDLDFLISLTTELPERRPIWFPRYPKVMDRKPGDPRLPKGIRRQRRWEEARLQQAIKEGNLWTSPEKRNTSAHPFLAGTSSTSSSSSQPTTISKQPTSTKPPPKKRNPLDLLLRGSSLLPKQTQLQHHKKPEPGFYVPFPKELKRKEMKEREEEKREKVKREVERKRRLSEAVRGLGGVGKEGGKAEGGKGKLERGKIGGRSGAGFGRMKSGSRKKLRMSRR